MARDAEDLRRRVYSREQVATQAVSSSLNICS